MSSRTPRVNRAPTCSTPSRENPVRLAAWSSVTQLYMLDPIIWWLNVSNWVPTCPISDTTSSSFEPRRLRPGSSRVRFVINSKRRPAGSGIESVRTRPSSNTSPARISRAALSTVSGFMWLPEPRWSVAPHFDGQRWLSAGGCHPCAAAVAPTHSSAAKTNEALDQNIMSSAIGRGWQRGTLPPSHLC